MVRRHYNLPSLNALAAFEAAARHLSLTRAANELNVTPGAVSRQVKVLEEGLGRPLFVRLHRALELTPEGEAVARSLQEAFTRVSATLQQISLRPAGRVVAIGSTMAFAQYWLMPRLHSFWSTHQDIVVDHMISDRDADLLRTDVDLRIRYGSGHWPEETAVRFFDDHIAAVASPDYVRRHSITSPRDMAGLQLLSVEGVDWSWTGWADFLRAAGVPVRKLNVRRFNSYVIALQAAGDGQGLALGWMNMIAPLLERKALVQVTDVVMPAPQSFYVTWSSSRPLSPAAAVLRDWLLAQVD